jgi:hypothetical protein
MSMPRGTTLVTQGAHNKTESDAPPAALQPWPPVPGAGGGRGEGDVFGSEGLYSGGLWPGGGGEGEVFGSDGLYSGPDGL